MYSNVFNSIKTLTKRASELEGTILWDPCFMSWTTLFYDKQCFKWYSCTKRARLNKI